MIFKTIRLPVYIVKQMRYGAEQKLQKNPAKGIEEFAHRLLKKSEKTSLQNTKINYIILNILIFLIWHTPC